MSAERTCFMLFSVIILFNVANVINVANVANVLRPPAFGLELEQVGWKRRKDKLLPRIGTMSRKKIQPLKYFRKNQGPFMRFGQLLTSSYFPLTHLHKHIMKIYFYLLAGLAMLTAFSSYSAVILTGTVTGENGEPLKGVTVKFLKDGDFVRGTMTDMEGNYRVDLDPGTYAAEVTYTGYQPLHQENILITAGQPATWNFSLLSGLVLDEVTISAFKVPLINKDGTESGSTLHSAALSGQPKSKKGRRAAKKSRQWTPKNSIIYTDGQEAHRKRSIFHLDRKRKAIPDSLIHDREQYNTIVENSYQNTRSNSISTFSIDVDAASYANLRRMINTGRTPPPDAVRIEEMINYFDYHYPQPTKQHPFEVSTEIAPCPWAPQHQLLLIGLQGRSVDVGQLPATNLVFLIDVSGSMNSEDKLPLVQQSLNLLTDQLRPTDRVAIVVYAGAAGTVLESTLGTDKLEIKAAINRLQAGGSTAGGEGIALAYKMARKNFITHGNNRVILCTDGDFNVGVSCEEELVKLIEQERSSGVYLTVLGFGTGNYQDGKMQELADRGNGNHAYIDGLSEARKVLVQEFSGTLFAIAKDVKLQLHFNPAHIAGYRLIGYENRMLATEDFEDDRKDAGELGAGHRVTALYELIPVQQKSPASTQPGLSLVTIDQPDTTVSVQKDNLLVLRLRYKQPKGIRSRLMEYRLSAAALAQSSENENMLLASTIAEFGLLLRNSKYKGLATYEQTLERARKAAKVDPTGYRTELLGLIEKASKMSPPTASSRQ